MPLHAEYQSILEDDVAAVAIATHYAVAKDALLAGKDVFVEKPITMSVAEAEELVRIADEKGRVLMVGHQV